LFSLVSQSGGEDEACERRLEWTWNGGSNVSSGRDAGRHLLQIALFIALPWDALLFFPDCLMTASAAPFLRNRLIDQSRGPG